MTAVQGLCKTSPIQMKYKQSSLELRAFCANNLFTSQRKMKIWQCWILEMSEMLAMLAILEMLAMLAMLFTRILTGSARRTLCAFTGKASVGVN